MKKIALFVAVVVAATLLMVGYRQKTEPLQFRWGGGICLIFYILCDKIFIYIC